MLIPIALIAQVRKRSLQPSGRKLSLGMMGHWSKMHKGRSNDDCDAISELSIGRAARQNLESLHATLYLL
jgi:hypothetical protein